MTIYSPAAVKGLNQFFRAYFPVFTRNPAGSDVSQEESCREREKESARERERDVVLQRSSFL